MLLEAEDGSFRVLVLADGAPLLGGFARAAARELVAATHAVAAKSPFRRMHTPGGRRMSVAMTSCGGLGWVSDAHGYRYSAVDPQTGGRWPEMPACLARLAALAAEAAGFSGFEPDSCLVNRYEPGAGLSLHQDRNERDLGHPIVSVSLGLPAVFLWGGSRRDVAPRRVPLLSGDVVVWGGPARLTFHGVAPLPEGSHGLTGAARYNLTLRKAG